MKIKVPRHGMLYSQMSRDIRIDFAHIDKLYQHNDALERKAQILMRKKAIYEYRHHLLESISNIALDTSNFAQTEYGKPYLNIHAKISPKLAFNHSHSQNFYALATSSKLDDIGVDVEEINRKVRFDALAKHAFHSNEYRTWQELDKDLNYWFRVWTSKEAILKASGLGIRMSLNELDIGLHPLHHGGKFEHRNLGEFGYQNFNLQRSMLTIAWRAERSCQDFTFPEIEIIQHSNET